MLMSNATVKFQYLYINTYNHVCHWMEDFTKRRFHTEGQNSEAGKTIPQPSTIQAYDKNSSQILCRVKVLKFKFLNLIVLPCSPLFYVTSEMLKMDKLFWL